MDILEWLVRHVEIDDIGNPRYRFVENSNYIYWAYNRIMRDEIKSSTNMIIKHND